MKLDFVETCLNADDDSGFTVLLAQTFASGSLADFARLEKKRRKEIIRTYYIKNINFREYL